MPSMVSVTVAINQSLPSISLLSGVGGVVVSHYALTAVYHAWYGLGRMARSYYRKLII
jgi:hypothetical protein